MFERVNKWQAFLATILLSLHYYLWFAFAIASERFQFSSKMADNSNKQTPREFLTEFIELYRSFTCLWLVKSKEYSDRNKKDLAYTELHGKSCFGVDSCGRGQRNMTKCRYDLSQRVNSTPLFRFIGAINWSITSLRFLVACKPALTSFSVQFHLAKFLF